LSLFFVRSLSTKQIQYSEDVYYSVKDGVMHERNLDHEILKLMEAQPDIKEGEIASKLSVPEERYRYALQTLRIQGRKSLL
jgi:predicted transcriptional regulator